MGLSRYNGTNSSLVERSEYLEEAGIGCKIGLWSTTDIPFLERLTLVDGLRHKLLVVYGARNEVGVGFVGAQASRLHCCVRRGMLQSSG